MNTSIATRRAIGQVTASALLLWASSAMSANYVVRPDGTGDFPTIQAAIDACVDGDIVELADGMFSGDGNRDIDYLGKAITVRSQRLNPETCVIDCEGNSAGQHRGFVFQSHEGPGSVLEGIKIINGYMERGGAIACYDNSSPRISHCTLFRNHSTGRGAGIYSERSGPVISGCTIARNSAGIGGGAACWSMPGFPSPTLVQCLIVDNVAGWSGGMDCALLSSPTLVSCVFAGNSADFCGGVGLNDANVTIADCTFVANSSTISGGIISGRESSIVLERTIIAFTPAGEAVSCDNSSSATLSCCDIYGNEGGDWVGCIANQLGMDGNIHADPRFCDTADRDYTLQADSPCAPDNHSPECGLIGALPVACGPTPFEPTSWGSIKAAFQR